MAAEIIVPGKAVVSLGGSILGESRNGIILHETPFFNDVHGDAHGGDAGPPIDRQDLGYIAHVRLHLTKWDKAIWLNAMKKFSTRGTAGTVTAADIGKLYIGGSGFYSLSWTCAIDASFARTYPIALPAGEPQEINIGTVYAEAILAFECWRNPSTGVIWT
jgi:hypothetical protein